MKHLESPSTVSVWACISLLLDFIALCGSICEAGRLHLLIIGALAVIHRTPLVSTLVIHSLAELGLFGVTLSTLFAASRNVFAYESLRYETSDLFCADRCFCRTQMYPRPRHTHQTPLLSAWRVLVSVSFLAILSPIHPLFLTSLFRFVLFQLELMSRHRQTHQWHRALAGKHRGGRAAVVNTNSPSVRGCKSQHSSFASGATVVDVITRFSSLLLSPIQANTHWH